MTTNATVAGDVPSNSPEQPARLLDAGERFPLCGCKRCSTDNSRMAFDADKVLKMRIRNVGFQ